MKVVNNNFEVIKSGVIDTFNVGISDKPEDQLMILNILSDHLYTDKISAQWREYGCNGADAMVAAGKGDQPIEITLPTSEEPNAIIRDFGLGMSEEKVRDTYCKAGASTKRGTNRQIGFLGIGSKAGYAYGSTFTVTSFHEGTKTVYSCYRENTGTLQMSILHREPTTEQGVEISIPVRREDVSQFCERATRVFRYFKTVPKIKNDKEDSLSWQRPKAILSGDSWRLIGNGKSLAIMGNVAYEINPSKFPTDYPTNKISLLNSGVELEFNIGDLEIAANRESIQYKRKTLKALSRVLGTALVEVEAKINSKFAEAKTFWDACALYNKMFKYSYNNHLNEFRKNVSWNGIKIPEGGHILLDRKNGNKYSKPEGSVVREFQQSHGSSKQIRSHIPYDLTPSEHVLLVMNDNRSKKITVSKIRHWIHTHKDPKDHYCRTYVYVFTFDDETAKQNYIKEFHLEGAPFVLMSELPKPEKLGTATTSGPSKNAGKYMAKVFELAVTGRAYLKSDYWTPMTVDYKDGTGVYVIIDKFQVNGRQHPKNLLDLLTVCRNLKLLNSNDKVYGVRSKTAEKFGPGWVTLTQTLKTALADQLKQNPKLSQQLADASAAGQWYPKMILNKNWLPSIPKKSKIALLNNAFYGVDRRIPKDYDYLFKRCSKLIEALPKPTVNFQELSKEVENHYPMVALIDGYQLKGDDKCIREAVINYINLIEKESRKI